MIDLRETARRHDCRERRGMQLFRRRMNSTLAASTLSSAARRSGEKILLYGGQTATPLFYGYKAMRVFTNDFDFAVRQEDLEAVLDALNPAFDTQHRVFFGYIDGVLYSLTAGRIHDWEIPDDFFDSARHYCSEDGSLDVCSPEYTIMLKFRRGAEHGELFGKDAIDIINLLIAPLFRKGMPLVSLEKTAELIRTYCGDVAETLSRQISPRIDNLPLRERPLARRMFTSFRKKLTGVAAW